MAVPYPLFPHHATHPDHLLALGRWLGVDVPDPSGSLRVLELGCAAGGNLLPMAVREPGWRVEGVDLAAHEVARGQALAAAAGATNLRLEVGDVAALGDRGTYDVIVAHGLLSWVPPAVADALLAFVGRSLAPGGVAYVSYNVAAGWAHRGQLRDWLLARVDADDEQARVDQARALLPEAPAVVAELARAVASESDAYISQDYLAVFNEALAFPALAARAEAVGLSAVADANGACPVLGGRWSPSGSAARAAVGEDPVAQEAWLDAQQGRSFRSTVLVRAPRPAWRGPEGLAFTTALRRVDGAPVDAPGPTRFASAWGAHATIADPMVKGLLGRLGAAWPRAVPFAALAESLGPHAEPVLSVLVGSNLVHPRLREGAPRAPGLCPDVPRDVRVLAREGAGWAADAHHRGHRLDAADRALLPLCDGTRRTEALASTLGWAPERVARELASAWERGLRLA